MKLIKLLSALLVLTIVILTTCKKPEEIIKPKACFTMSKTEAAVNEQITFTNCSENAESYLWNFGDGITSTEKNPTHAYTEDENYIINLRVKNGDNYDQATKSITIIGIPSLSTGSVSNITTTTASITGNISDLAGNTITQHGHCWSTNQNPTTDLSTKTTLGTRTSAGDFTSNLTNLSPSTTYYIRAYATSSTGTVYGNQLEFPTLEITGLPTVTTTTINDITVNSAVSGGNVTDDGGATVTAKGVCWSTSSNPTLSDNLTNDGSGTGVFTSNITGLSASTTYYVRAYATNSAGTSYGNQLNFTTFTGITTPTLTTTAISAITENSAVSGGNISYNGGATITARGVCWSTTQNPTISDAFTTDGTGTGSFTSNITGLTANSTYYVRAYATNSTGTAYGNQLEFTTLEITGLPTVTTTAISSITVNSAVSGGDVTSDGGATVTAKGVCWSTSSNPTLSDNLTNNGLGTGTFVSDITGLTENTTYYVRAYATNSVGTAFSDELTFTTSSENPIITTKDITSITDNSAVCGGTVIEEGEHGINICGVCYGTSPNPDINGLHTDATYTDSSFTSTMQELSPVTTYYVRAYVISSFVYFYGDEKTFTTDTVDPCNGISTVTDYDGNYYNTVAIGNQCWMKENLQTTSYADGTALVNGTSAGDITGDDTTKYYFAYDDNEGNVPIYGRLYTWAAIMNEATSSNANPSGVQGVCPTGWHVPSDAEWTELTDYLGGESVAGGKMKEVGTTHWTSPNTDATNESGFTALPNGYRNYDSTFDGIGYNGHYWNSTEYSTTNAWNRNMNYSISNVNRDNHYKNYGFSVRCVKD
ncbi:MAG: hypothetical protein KAT68_16795 [Bacteroidales bacterium]|nr:hypothetical protein [Bacteroidales bacterium]